MTTAKEISIEDSTAPASADDLPQDVQIVPVERMRQFVFSCAGCREFLNEVPTGPLVTVDHRFHPYCEFCASEKIETLVRNEGGLYAMTTLLDPVTRFIDELRNKPDPLAQIVADTVKANEKFVEEMLKKNAKETEKL